MFLFIVYFIIINILIRKRLVPGEQRKKYCTFVLSYGLFTSFLVFLLTLCFYFVVNDLHSGIASLIAAVVMTFLVQLLGEFVKGANQYTGLVLDNKQLLKIIEGFNINTAIEIQELNEKLDNLNDTNVKLLESLKENTKNEIYLNIAGFEIKINKKSGN